MTRLNNDINDEGKTCFQYVCIEIKIVNVVDYIIWIWILMAIYSLGEECVDVILSS